MKHTPSAPERFSDNPFLPPMNGGRFVFPDEWTAVQRRQFIERIRAAAVLRKQLRG